MSAGIKFPSTIEGQMMLLAIGAIVMVAAVIAMLLYLKAQIAERQARLQANIPPRIDAEYKRYYFVAFAIDYEMRDSAQALMFVAFCSMFYIKEPWFPLYLAYLIGGAVIAFIGARVQARWILSMIESHPAVFEEYFEKWLGMRRSALNEGLMASAERGRKLVAFTSQSIKEMYKKFNWRPKSLPVLALYSLYLLASTAILYYASPDPRVPIIFPLPALYILYSLHKCIIPFAWRRTIAEDLLKNNGARYIEFKRKYQLAIEQ